MIEGGGADTDAGAAQATGARRSRMSVKATTDLFMISPFSIWVRCL
jgi:hypothetical protein